MLKSPIAITAVLLASAAAVAAGPFQALVRFIELAESRLDAAGAVYFITNEPDENVVMAASIGRDGSLTLEKAVAAGGRGLHGIATPPGADGLFSQSSIQASAKGQVLATVNPGSNTVSLFSINPKSPTDIKPLGDPVSSEGEFPMSLTFNSNGTRLCVLNGGAVASVNCFNVDSKRGLVSIPDSLRTLNLNQTTPPVGPPGTVMRSPRGYAVRRLARRARRRRLAGSVLSRFPLPSLPRLAYSLYRSESIS